MLSPARSESWYCSFHSSDRSTYHKHGLSLRLTSSFDKFDKHPPRSTYLAPHLSPPVACQSIDRSILASLTAPFYNSALDSEPSLGLLHLPMVALPRLSALLYLRHLAPLLTRSSVLVDRMPVYPPSLSLVESLIN